MVQITDQENSAIHDLERANDDLLDLAKMAFPTPTEPIAKIISSAKAAATAMRIARMNHHIDADKQQDDERRLEKHNALQAEIDKSMKNLAEARAFGNI